MGNNNTITLQTLSVTSPLKTQEATWLSIQAKNVLFALKNKTIWKSYLKISLWCLNITNMKTLSHVSVNGNFLLRDRIMFCNILKIIWGCMEFVESNLKKYFFVLLNLLFLTPMDSLYERINWLDSSEFKKKGCHLCAYLQCVI